MSERDFQMRLSCRYRDPDNSVAELSVQHLDKGEWQDFELDAQSPGFLIFVYAIFTCQHLYLRANCAERGLVLESSSGSIHVVTAQDWDIRRLHVRFDGKLRSGTALTEDVDYIVGRMQQCPVSRNVTDVRDSETVVHLS
jgi:hypothetical protein